MEKLISNLFEANSIPISEIECIKTFGNVSYLVKSPDNKYIVRLCGVGRRFRCKNEVLSEISLLKFLNDNNFPVPKLISFNSKELISLGNRNGICYSYAEGEILSTCKENHCYELGLVLGNLHNATLNFSIPFERKKWDLEATKELFNELDGWFKENKFLESYNFSERIENILFSLSFSSSLSSGAIHEDLGMRHVIFNKEKISCVIDWDRFYRGYFILDLGQAIRGWCFEDWKVLNKQKLNCLLEGYMSVRQLSSLEKESLYDAVKFAFIERIISFALHGIKTNDDKLLKYAIEDLELVSNLEEIKC